MPFPAEWFQPILPINLPFYIKVASSYHYSKKIDLGEMYIFTVVLIFTYS